MSRKILLGGASALAILVAASAADAATFMTPGEASFTATVTGEYSFEALGASGGNFQQTLGGPGAGVSGDLFLTAGEQLTLFVGGRGGDAFVPGSGYAGGGGGGSFISWEPGRARPIFLPPLAAAEARASAAVAARASPAKTAAIAAARADMSVSAVSGAGAAEGETTLAIAAAARASKAPEATAHKPATERAATAATPSRRRPAATGKTPAGAARSAGAEGAAASAPAGAGAATRAAVGAPFTAVAATAAKGYGGGGGGFFVSTLVSNGATAAGQNSGDGFYRHCAADPRGPRTFDLGDDARRLCRPRLARADAQAQELAGLAGRLLRVNADRCSRPPKPTRRPSPTLTSRPRLA